MDLVEAPDRREPMRKMRRPWETTSDIPEAASPARPWLHNAGWLTAERFVHALFGNNIVIGSHVLRQLDCLREVAPPGFRGRRVDDLGCGDGKLTVFLREILQPVRLRGFDINPALVRRARSRGIEARVVDLDARVPSGELAVLWGVLHHLSDPARCLARVRANYDCALIREPIRGASPACFELGSPLRKRELSDLFRESLPGSDLFYYDDCALAFWDSQNQAGVEPPVAGDAVEVVAGGPSRAFLPRRG
jgi:SAM-dependent methyltransferase